MINKLQFYTEHKQFYISDKESPKKIGGENNFWTREADKARLAIGEGILGVATESYGYVNAELITLNEPATAENYEVYDHIVEGGIKIDSGVLQVLSCTDFSVQLEIALKVGTYKVRVYSMDLRSVTDDSGEDFYKIEVWPSMEMRRIVVKQFEY